MVPRSRSAKPLRSLLAVAAVALVPAVAGCEAGLNAPTLDWHQPTAGASILVDNTIQVSNMFVLGAAPTLTLARGGSAGVFFALTNSGQPDELLSISAPGSARSVRLPGGGVRIGAKQAVYLMGPAPQVILEGLLRQVNGGSSVRLVLSFANAGTVAVQVPVMPRSGAYATYLPAPRPSSPRPTPPATGGHRPSPSPSGSVTPVPSATPSPSPS